MLNFLGVAEVNDKSPGTTVFEIDCLKVDTAPNLTFVIDEAYYEIPPTVYIKKKADGPLFKSSTCYVALLPNPSAAKWLLGTNFLANFYSIFDNLFL